MLILISGFSARAEASGSMLGSSYRARVHTTWYNTGHKNPFLNFNET